MGAGIHHNEDKENNITSIGNKAGAYKLGQRQEFIFD
jgi:hypothetical protein